MEDFNILGLIYDAAHNFIATNRPNEIKLFETFYPTKLPHDSFVSVYESGRESGIMKHSDHVSFCTVVFCLQGTGGEKDLTLILESNDTFEVPLSASDLIVFGRIEHFVGFRSRSERRITINAFF